MNKSVLLGTALSVALLVARPAFAGLGEALTAFEIKRYDQAFAELNLLANEGDAVAAYYLGKMYAQGLGVEKNEAMAVEYYQKAEGAYNIDAAYELAEILLSEAKDREDESFVDGLRYLKRAAYAGQADALYQLGEFYENGSWVERDFKNAFGYYLMGALKGDAKCQYRLSLLYLDGRGVPRDFENAIKWMSRSARQGYVVAQNALANARVDIPALRNIADAYAWFSVIAAYNSDEIGENARKRRNELEKKLNKGSVLLERQRSAREWRPIPPEQSVPMSDLLVIPTPIIPGFNDPETVQEMLAQGEVLMTDGRKFGVKPDMVVKAGITKNLDPIEKTVEKAIAKGDIQACAYYADLLRSRFQNMEKAVEWYRRGAEGGDAYAQYQLAKAYCEGNGVDAARPGQCYAWLKIADENSTYTLKLTIQNALKIVEESLTPEELAQGETLVGEYQAKTSKGSKAKDLLNLF